MTSSQRRRNLLAGLSLCLAGLLAIPCARAESYHVDAHASDGGDGSSTHPFRTIQQGVDCAQAGDTVIVHEGTYKEQVVVNHGGAPGQPLSIVADPIGAVVVDGADPLKDFEEDASRQTADKTRVWVCKDYRSPYVPMGNDYNLRDSWLKEGEVGKQQVELLSRNDMIWLDGRFLDEVDAPDQLRFGTFWVDRQKGGLYLPLIATDRPESHRVEAAQRNTLLTGSPHSSFIHLRGFHFTRVAGGGGKPVVRVGDQTAEGWVVEDNMADWGTYSGFAIYGKNHQILRNVAAHNGDEGMQGIMQDTLLDGNSSLYNNWKAIRDTYESGGGKFTESENVTIRNHLAAYNLGPGLWFDINNRGITIERSRFHDNKYAGIFMEIAPGPTVIRENVCWANQGAGILIGESTNALVENNISAYNWYGVELRNLQGRHGRFGDDTPNTNGERLWQTADVTIRNNILSQNLRAGIGNTCYYLDPVARRISSDYNTFWGNHFFWWKLPDPKGPDAGTARPSQVIATIDGSWVMTNIYSQDKFGGMDQHSVWKDPKFPNGEMYQFPMPVPAAAKP